MTWPFCPSCRSTLKVDSSGSISCNVCPYTSNLGELAPSEIPVSLTYSAPRATPLWAKTDEEQQALRQSKEPTRATIEEPCPKCGTHEVGYYTVQLRSVDEGQTVFYECPACKHTWIAFGRQRFMGYHRIEEVHSGEKLRRVYYRKNNWTLEVVTNRTPLSICLGDDQLFF